MAERRNNCVELLAVMQVEIIVRSQRRPKTSLTLQRPRVDIQYLFCIVGIFGSAGTSSRL